MSSNFFAVLGVPVALGRDFSNDDERPGNNRVVIISDGLWRQRYGADPVYGVVSHNVARRTREIGLRMALGAVRSQVLRSIVVAGMRPVVAGLAVGLVAAIAIANVLRGLLFGIAPADPLAIGSVAVVLLVTSGVACYLPARRAARLDLAMALRAD